jgi:hypothetical protein
MLLYIGLREQDCHNKPVWVGFKTKVTRSDDLVLVEARVFGILAKYIDILCKDWIPLVQLAYEAKEIFF